MGTVKCHEMILHTTRHVAKNKVLDTTKRGISQALWNFVNTVFIMETGVIFCYAASFFCCLYLWKALVSRYWLNLPPSPWPLPLIGHMHLLIKGLPHQSLQVLSKVYGPVFFLRLGANPFVVITSRELAREVLKTHDREFASRPYTLVGDVTYSFQGMVLSPYNDHWKDLRKLCTTELFTSRRIDSFQSVRIDELQNLIMALRSSQGRPVNMRTMLTSYNFNVISQTLISKRFCSLNGSGGTDPGAQEFMKVSREAILQSFQFHLSDYVPSYLRWADWTVPEFRRLHSKLDKFMQKLVDERKAEQKSARKLEDFLDIIMKHTKDYPEGEEITKAMMLELLMAGSDTTSTILEWTIAELLSNPHSLAAAHEELGRVVGSKLMVEESDFMHLEYLQAVIKEVFRLHPPLGLLVPHAATQPCNLAGYSIPKGAALLINVYAIARDPLLWDSPEEFKPERFMGKKIDVKGQDYELLPFGSGRRACPGMVLGLKTLQLVLFNLLHHFNWSYVPGRKNKLEEVYGTVSWLKTPLEVIASPKEVQVL